MNQSNEDNKEEEDQDNKEEEDQDDKSEQDKKEEDQDDEAEGSVEQEEEEDYSGEDGDLGKHFSFSKISVVFWDQFVCHTLRLLEFIFISFQLKMDPEITNMASIGG